LKKEEVNRRCEEMRRSNQPLSPPVNEPVSSVRPAGGRRSLKDAASELGVSYWTARRIFIAENVGRYSTAGEIPVYRMKDITYIVDRLFEHAQLVLGSGKKAQRVEITRDHRG
jgi:hypothetical protein